MTDDQQKQIEYMRSRVRHHLELAGDIAIGVVRLRFEAGEFPEIQDLDDETAGRLATTEIQEQQHE